MFLAYFILIDLERLAYKKWYFSVSDLQELQGEVVTYYIDYRWASGYVSLEYQPGVVSDILDDLDPNTQYEFKQTIFNGAYNITSPPAFAETYDGGMRVFQFSNSEKK